MEIIDTKFDGVKLFNGNVFQDERGIFIKNFSHSVYKKFMKKEIKEIYYSTSSKNVLRGMHFQVAPFEHEKIVHVIDGSILDVVVDIKKDSPTFGEYFSTTMGGFDNRSVYMNEDFAHGFLTLSETATVLYAVTSEYNKDCDTGIKWDSFNFNWGVENLIISERDKNFRSLKAFYE